MKLVTPALIVRRKNMYIISTSGPPTGTNRAIRDFSVKSGALLETIPFVGWMILIHPQIRNRQITSGYLGYLVALTAQMPNVPLRLGTLKPFQLRTRTLW